MSEQAQNVLEEFPHCCRLIHGRQVAIVRAEGRGDNGLEMADLGYNARAYLGSPPQPLSEP